MDMLDAGDNITHAAAHETANAPGQRIEDKLQRGAALFKHGQIAFGAADVAGENHFASGAATNSSDFRRGGRKLKLTSCLSDWKAD